MSKKPYTSLTFEKRQIIENMAKKKQITVIMSLHEIDLAQKIADKIIHIKASAKKQLCYFKTNRYYNSSQDNPFSAL